jgi:hypothetical protein
MLDWYTLSALNKKYKKQRKKKKRIEQNKPTIVAEIYEYRLSKYTIDKSHTFNNIVETKNKFNCGLFEVKDNVEMQDTKQDEFSSCDLIENDNKKDMLDQYIKLDWSYFNYLYLNMSSKSQLTGIKYDLNDVIQIENTLTQAYLSMKRYNQKNCYESIEYELGLSDEALRETSVDIMIDTKFKDFQQFYDHCFIYNLYVNKTDKCIIFGDIHGSFHTFYRNLIRLHKFNVINLKQYKVMDNYKLIFLGDVVERGQYAIEILYIISKFIANNNTETELKVIYNRGNHDDYNLNIKMENSFANEIKMKTAENHIRLYNKFNCLFSLLSTAIIMTFENKRIWMCHGGLPLYIDDETRMKLNQTSKQVLFFKNYSLIYQIKWNDFTSSKTSESSISNRGKNVPNFLRNTKIYQIHESGVQTHMNLYNIDFIIRGHQDNYANSMIFPNPIDNTTQHGHLILNSLHSSIPNIQINPTNQESRRVHGPIAKINVSHSKSVLTISTNTDIGKSLTRDSFIVLRFDGDYLNSSQFEQYHNTFDIRNTSINNHTILLDQQNLAFIE